MHRTQRDPVDDASPALWAGRKVPETHKVLLWQFLNDDPNQGHSVFQGNTNEGQGESRLSREAAARGRNIGVACRSQQSNSGIA